MQSQSEVDRSERGMARITVALGKGSLFQLVNNKLRSSYFFAVISLYLEAFSKIKVILDDLQELTSKAGVSHLAL
jgi:hypothetical protein